MSDFTIEELSATIPLEEYIPACVDVAKFDACCRGCENYGKRWSCPPFAFDPMTIWCRYRTLHLRATLLRPAPSTPYSALLPALSRTKSALLRTLLEEEKRHSGSLALSAGTCELCERCAKADGKPCVYPEQLRYSIEALGGDVEKTCSTYLNAPICWIDPPNLPEYVLLVGGLLLP